MNRLRLLIRVAAGIAVAAAFAVPSPAAAFSTNGQCLGLMVQTATVELPPGFWSEDEHTLAVRYVDPMFGVDDRAELYPGQVRVDQDGLYRGYLDVADQTINPQQDTVLWAAWFADMTGEMFGGPPTSMQDLKLDAAQAWIAFSVDGGPWMRADMSPFHSVCANGALGGTNDVPLFHRTWGPPR